MSLRLLLLLATILPSAAPAHGAGTAVRFVVTGTVTEPGGRPVRGARVALAGAPGAVGTTDADGRYALTHRVPDLAAARAPLLLVLRARHRGWNLALSSGEPSLAVELRRVAAGDGARIEVRANDADVARAVARALGGGGEAVVALDARFTRLVGREDRSVPGLTALEVVALAVPESAPEPAPALEPAAPAPRVAPTDPAVPTTLGVAAADTVSRPGIRVSLRPDTAAAGPSPAPGPAESPLRVALGRVVPGRRAAPPTGGCACRVSGTVEVRPESPVYGGPRVVVTLAGRPAIRDTVAMFMGPPRSFDLGRVPCGRHALEVLPLSGRRLVRVEPDSTGFTCAAGGVQQFRVVLEPR